MLNTNPRISIDEVETSNGTEFDIIYEGDGDISTIARCWDYLLAEKLKDAVSEYMQDEYKVVGQEDAERI